MMTLHLSKGLEYKNVFVVGMEEGLFPSASKLDESDPTAVEEERRLAYVGMTRARENLHLTYAKMRRVWGQDEYRQASRFINEIPESYIVSNTDRKKTSFLDRYRDKYSQPSTFERKKQTGTHHVPEYENFSDDVYQSAEKRLNDFKNGMRVRHPIFGVGSIFLVEGSGDEQKVSVLFQDKSLKKFMTKHARLEKI
jgi:DNA helicase-2/ATP-dependent DNA helicase PcrA